jgi:hypothetical protein
MMKTAGIWRSGTKYGYYRIVVRRQGFEHGMDQVELQILEADGNAMKRQPVHCIDLETPGLKGYITDVTLRAIDDRIVAIELDIEMKAMDGIVAREILVASYDGKVRVVAEAKSIDVTLFTESLISPKSKTKAPAIIPNSPTGIDSHR